MVVLFLVRMYPTHGRQPGGKILICCCLFHTKVVSLTVGTSVEF